ncbi:MAG: hypothetical protein IT192_07960 [Microbacteriaceae bacterium]|nr:hypothetical protein [Microbacteriaceae bacterium]
MELPVWVLLASLAVLLLWGVIAPRSLWKVAASWSYRNPHFDEPTGSAFALSRFIASAGLTALLIAGFVSWQVWLSRQPVPPPPPTQVELMWGKPEPAVVNRVITGTTSIPTGLISQPILGFQPVKGQNRQPVYLFDLKNFDLKDATDANGLAGHPPSPGLLALDTADLVVKVTGDSRCFPHEVVVRETATQVQIGVYYGQKKPTDGSNDDQVANCLVTSNPQNLPTLIPIQLQEPLDKRAVVDMNGYPIFEVRNPSDAD